MRPIEAIQARGQWANPRSAARHKKPGAYARTMQHIPPAVIAKHSAALNSVEQLLR